MSFLDYVYQQGALVHVLDVVTQRSDYVYNEECCWFPYLEDPDPFFYFEGVKFGLVDESAIVVIPETDCWLHFQQFMKAKVDLDDADMTAIERMLARVFQKR